MKRIATLVVAGMITLALGRPTQSPESVNVYKDIRLSNSHILDSVSGNTSEFANPVRPEVTTTSTSEMRLSSPQEMQICEAIRCLRRAGEGKAADELFGMLKGSDHPLRDIRIDRSLPPDVQAERRDGYIVLNPKLLCDADRYPVVRTNRARWQAEAWKISVMCLAAVLRHELEHERHNDGPYNFITRITQRPNDERRALRAEITACEALKTLAAGRVRAMLDTQIEMAQSEFIETWGRAPEMQMRTLRIALGTFVAFVVGFACFRKPPSKARKKGGTVALGHAI